MTRNGTCNCEHCVCEAAGLHRAGSCKEDASKGGPFGVVKVLDLGPVCWRCSQRYDQKYLLPPYGTAKR